MFPAVEKRYKEVSHFIGSLAIHYWFDSFASYNRLRKGGTNVTARGRWLHGPTQNHAFEYKPEKIIRHRNHNAGVHEALSTKTPRRDQIWLGCQIATSQLEAEFEVEPVGLEPAPVTHTARHSKLVLYEVYVEVRIGPGGKWLLGRTAAPNSSHSLESQLEFSSPAAPQMSIGFPVFLVGAVGSQCLASFRIGDYRQLDKAVSYRGAPFVAAWEVLPNPTRRVSRDLVKTAHTSFTDISATQRATSAQIVSG